MVERKNPGEMEESELKEELKRLYKKINDLSAEEIASMSFEGSVIVEKKNSDDEVVERHEVDL